MLHLTYLNEPRVVAIYAQIVERPLAKVVVETSRSQSAGASGGFKPLLSADLTSGSLERRTQEELAVPELRLRHILQNGVGFGVLFSLDSSTSWTRVDPGSLVLLSGTFLLETFGVKREEVWQASSERAVPLALRGMLHDRQVEIPFTTRNVLGMSALMILCRFDTVHTELLGLIASPLDNSPIIIQAVAFGTGLLKEKTLTTETKREARVDDIGWITCPGCGRRFGTNNTAKWDGKRHQTCGQRIKLV